MQSTIIKYIIVYLVLLGAFLLYMRRDSASTVSDITAAKEANRIKNTKRAQAIEQFRNYETTVVNKLRKQCRQTNTQNTPTSEEQYLGRAINPELGRVLKQAFSGSIPMEVLDNYMVNLDRHLELATSDMFETMDTIYQRSTPEMEAGARSEMETWLYARFPREITTFMDRRLLLDLDRLIATSDTTSGIDQRTARQVLLSPKLRRQLLEPLTIEFKDRLAAKFRSEYQQVYDNVCDGLPLPPAEMARIPVNLDTSRQRLLLYILVALATTDPARARLREQYQVLSTNMIQPLADRDISDMAMLSDIVSQRQSVKGQLGLDISGGGMAAAQELDMAEMYAKSYQDYLAAQQKHEIANAVDPIRALDMLESGVINRAESFSNWGQLSGESSNKSSMVTRSCNTKNTRVCGATNRFGTQSNFRGTYLASNHNQTPRQQLMNNISLGEPITHPSIVTSTTTNMREGFANPSTMQEIATEESTLPVFAQEIGSPITPEQGVIEKRLDTVLENMPGFARYAISVAKNVIGSDIVDGTITAIGKDNNMIPVGILVIMLSIVLFFIDVSS